MLWFLQILVWWSLLGIILVIAHYAYMIEKYEPVPLKEARLTEVDTWMTLGLFLIGGPFVYILMIMALINFLFKKVKK